VIDFFFRPLDWCAGEAFCFCERDAEWIGWCVDAGVLGGYVLK